MDLALTFGATVGASLFEALFTAIFVSLGAGGVLWWFQSKEARRQATLANTRTTEERKLSEAHDKTQAANERDYQIRTALRETYAQLLIVQRLSRQASMALATSAGQLHVAIEAHDEFIDAYHRISLDADAPMWSDLKELRRALDLLLYYAQKGDIPRCRVLFEAARKARQNLEQSFRKRLDHESLMEVEQVTGLDGWRNVRDETFGTFWVGNQVNPSAGVSQ